MQSFRAHLLTGLLVWVPLGVTLWLVSTVVGILDQSLQILPRTWQPQVWLGFSIPGLGAVFTVLLIWLTGFITANYVGQAIMSWWERLLQRIPFINSVYASVKQVSDTLLSSSGKAFRKAVLVPFPTTGSWAVGFITGQVSDQFVQNVQSGLVSVFVPTAPNPTSGFLLIVEASQLRDLNLSVDEALKYAVSMGVVSPLFSSTEKLK
jgi:uncharacterized membrane protein